MRAQVPMSQGLTDFITKHHDDYDAFIFFTAARRIVVESRVPLIWFWISQRITNAPSQESGSGLSGIVTQPA